MTTTRMTYTAGFLCFMNHYIENTNFTEIFAKLAAKLGLGKFFTVKIFETKVQIKNTEKAVSVHIEMVQKLKVKKNDQRPSKVARKMKRKELFQQQGRNIYPRPGSSSTSSSSTTSSQEIRSPAFDVQTQVLKPGLHNNSSSSAPTTATVSNNSVVPSTDSRMDLSRPELKELGTNPTSSLLGAKGAVTHNMVILPKRQHKRKPTASPEKPSAAARRSSQTTGNKPGQSLSPETLQISSSAFHAVQYQQMYDLLRAKYLVASNWKTPPFEVDEQFKVAARFMQSATPRHMGGDFKALAIKAFQGWQAKWMKDKHWKQVVVRPEDIQLDE